MGIMKKLILFFLSVVFAGFFLGCATLSKNECLEADWHEIGYRDGSMGAPRSFLQEHSEACVKHNVRADREAYYRGRHEGLNVYCTPDNGFNQGRQGRKYNYVCPPDLEREFLAGYKKGKEIYKYESKISSLEGRLRSIESQIQTKEKQLYSSNLSKEQRAKIRADLKYLDIQYRDTVRELRYWEKMTPVE
jgi:hypothetical protein